MKVLNNFACYLANFIFKNEELQFDESFKKLFTESNKIKVVLLIGKSRQGKSTLGNYLMNPNFGPIVNGKYVNRQDKKFEIFPTKAGDNPITSGIQGTKISARKFKEMHGLTSTNEEEEDYDIIFLDTEGFGTSIDINGTREHYFICLLTLLGVSSIILDVSKESAVNYDRIENIQKNVVLSALMKENKNSITYIALLNGYTDDYGDDIDDEEDPEVRGNLMFEMLTNKSGDREADLIKKVNEDIIFDSLQFMIIPDAGRDENFVCFKLALKKLKQKIINQGEIHDGNKLWNIFIESAKGMYQKFRKCLEKLDDMKKIYYEYLKNEISNLKNDFLMDIPDKLEMYLDPYFERQEEVDLLKVDFASINEGISKEFDENFTKTIKIFKNTSYDTEISGMIKNIKNELHNNFRAEAERNIIRFNEEIHLKKERDKTVHGVILKKMAQSYEYTRYLFTCYIGKYKEFKKDKEIRNLESEFWLSSKDLRWIPGARRGTSYLSSTYRTRDFIRCRYEIITHYLKIIVDEEKENYKPISYKLQGDDTIYDIKDGLIFPVDGGNKTCNIEYIQLEKIPQKIVPEYQRTKTESSIHAKF